MSVMQMEDESTFTALTRQKTLMNAKWVVRSHAKDATLAKAVLYVMASVKHVLRSVKLVNQGTIGVKFASQDLIGLAGFASQDTTGVNTVKQVITGANFASQDTSIGHVKYASPATTATRAAKNAKSLAKDVK
jgi:hypothetical protein